MKTITPHLWFDKQAREAAEFYVSAIPNSVVTSVKVLSGTPSGECDLVSFVLAGQPFMAISAGPLFKFNPSVSFHIRCGSENEVDQVWEKLSPGGKELMPLGAYPFNPRFGWIQDRYGLSWQLLCSPDTPPNQKIAPALLFVGDMCGKAEEAISFYVSVFNGRPEGQTVESKANVLARYGRGQEPEREGNVQFAQFSLNGQEFSAMDSARSHNFSFNEAISFSVPCDTQEEIDYFWTKLSAHPKAEQCGWLKDKYGLSWQIVPASMSQLLRNADQSVMQTFLKMKKPDIAALQQAGAR